MKQPRLLLSLLGFCLVLFACKKEQSFETGGTPSVGSLQSDATGDCLPKTVAGAYEEGVVLDGAANYVEVEVSVTEPGTYTIASDTVNGISFKAVGIFGSTGLQTIKLKGSGTPFAAGSHHFVITYNGTQCVVTVITLPAGGAVPAVFTLIGSPGNCTGANVLGTYQAGVALNSSNQVEINVDVTTKGTYEVITQVSNGIFFQATGTFDQFGPQLLTLTGSGTPVAAGGSTNIVITVASTTCSFPVTVVGPAEFTVDCGSAVPNGAYQNGIELNGSNTVSLTVNVTVPGAYNITASVNGMTFAATGNFALSGPGQPLILEATGTPTTTGTNTVQLNAGATPCSFDVEVEDEVTITGSWSFTEGTTTFTGTVLDAGTDGASTPGVLFFGFIGQTAAGELLDLEFADVDATITNGETYQCNQTTTNFSGFYFDPAPPGTTPIYIADPGVLPNTVVLTVTNHDVANKTITGTFSGQAQTGTGSQVNITNGSFTFNYP